MKLVRKKTKCPLLTSATPATTQLDTTCSDAARSPYLKEVLHEIPVEPLTGLPKIVHPFPATRTQTLLMPPLLVPANCTTKLNKVAKMKTAPFAMKPRC